MTKNKAATNRENSDTVNQDRLQITLGHHKSIWATTIAYYSCITSLTN